MYVGVGEGQGIVGGRSRSREGSGGESPRTTRAVGAAVIVAVAAWTPAGKLAMKEGFCCRMWRRFWRSHPHCWSGQGLAGKSQTHKLQDRIFYSQRLEELSQSALQDLQGKSKRIWMSVWELYPWNLLKIILPLQCLDSKDNVKTKQKKNQLWVCVSVCPFEKYVFMWTESLLPV